jgi:hypothetical protein
MTRIVRIVIEATHRENSAAPLAGALARFAAKNLNTMGYTVQDISCTDTEWAPLETPKPEIPELAAKSPELAAKSPELAAKPRELIDPGEYTVKELRHPSTLKGYIRRQLDSLHKREMKGKARDGAVAAIKDAIDRL